MAAQQIQIAETIRAMKLALKRRPDGVEDDDSAPAHTNRGNKLKRRSQFAREGRLDTSGGTAYRRQVNHAGYVRTTIHTNPALLDSDGEPASPTSSDNENERHLEPVEDDPFGEVQLEQLLRPLTAAHELVDHPSLSAAYKSKAITQMADETLEMLRRERETLWKAKRLLRRFRGEADWAPCEAFETEGDDLLLHDHSGEGHVNGLSAVPSITMSLDEAPLNLQEPLGEEHMTNGLSEAPAQPEQQAKNGVHAADMVAEPTMASHEPIQADEQPRPAEETTSQTSPQPQPHDPDTTMLDPQNPTPLPSSAENPALTSLRASPTGETNSDSASTAGHIMTTRARARSPQDQDGASIPPSPSPSSSASIPPIHPWFTASTRSLPSTDLSLPLAEAEDTRKLLLLYCQKQEQTIRSLETLAFGLQKADRLRKFVYESSKASEHLVEDGKGNLVTEMSDGEDWYDPAEWGLSELGGLGGVGWDGVLEKGKDEVEEPEEEGRKGIRRRRVTRVV